jgi:hypothetical protein
VRPFAAHPSNRHQAKSKTIGASRGKNHLPDIFCPWFYQITYKGSAGIHVYLPPIECTNSTTSTKCPECAILTSKLQVLNDRMHGQCGTAVHPAWKRFQGATNHVLRRLSFKCRSVHTPSLLYHKSTAECIIQMDQYSVIASCSGWVRSFFYGSAAPTERSAVALFRSFKALLPLPAKPPALLHLAVNKLNDRVIIKRQSSIACDW